MSNRNKIVFTLTVVFLSAATVGCRKEQHADKPTSKPTSKSEPQFNPRTKTSGDKTPTDAPIRAPGETLESVSQKLAEKWATTASMTADLLIEYRYSNPMGDFATIGRGTFAFQRKADKLLFRQELAYALTTTKDGREISRIEYFETSINDGEFYYVLRKKPASVDAEKWPEASDASQDGRTMFEKMSKSNKMSYIGKKEVNGRQVYVFEAKPKGESIMEKTVIEYDMETGAMNKATFLDWARYKDSSITFSNVKINPKIDPSQLKFVLPDGVELVDQTDR